MYGRVRKTCYFGIEVKRLRCRPVTAHGAGSTPVSPAMSKKYSVSLVTFFQDVMVVSYHGLKRGSRNMGVTIPPSMFDFLSGKTRWVFQ